MPDRDPKGPSCPYCGNGAKLVTGADVYPHRPDLSRLRFWRCAPCDAHVGCHRGTSIPLGVLAGPSLRKARMAAHAAFDPLWKVRGRGRGKKRSTAYAWLAGELGMPVERTHIGEFDEATCAKVVELCRRRTDD